MSKFYNPKTHEHPGTILTNIIVADANDPWLKFEKPYPSREDALKESSSANIYFYENDVIYEAHRIGAWEWIACTEVCCDGGINWDTYYAPTKEMLKEYLELRYKQLKYFEPELTQYGLYTIQVHYDGRCR